jgi:hypothetical protein
MDGRMNTTSPPKRCVVSPVNRIASFIEKTRLVLVAVGLAATVSGAAADAVIDWNEIALETATPLADPAEILRTIAIVQIGVFDAVNSITGDYEPYLEKIPAPQGASAEAAAIAAAHRALVALHPETAAVVDPLRESHLAAIADATARAHGVAVGIAAADAILALRADDGFDTVVPYTPGTRPGDWQPTPPDFTPAFRPGLGDVAPFSIKDGRRYLAEPPPALRSRKYARDFNEVKSVGAQNSPHRSADRTAAAHFYAAVGPQAIFFPVARQIAATQEKSLSENARIFALIGIAIWDAAIASFTTKYEYNFWRPVAAIRAAETDGNRRTEADPNWTPLVFTLPFPSYASGHATFAGAARVVLEDAFGQDGHSMTLTTPALPEIVLQYTTFKQITDDIDEARVYGGVHFRFDQERGARAGRRVGEYILCHELRAIRSRHDRPEGRSNRR